MKHVFAALYVAVAACGPGTREPTDASPDASVDAKAVADAHTAIFDTGPALSCFEPSITGQVALGIPHIQSCAIWTSLSEMTGDVILTRTGTEFSMAFAGGVTYAGTVTGTSVTLVYTLTHDFEDGCLWRSTETLTGTLDPASCMMTLGYEYMESIDVDNGTCATPCTGTSNLTMTIVPIIL